MKNFMTREAMHRYDDIIDLPHHVSKVHPQMSLSDRAAQFAPFAALTGHHEAVEETARLTDEKAELDEDIKITLDQQLKEIQKHPGKSSPVSITYFVPDPNKMGGSYVTVSGCVKKIDEYEKYVLLTDGTCIPICDIAWIEQQ